MMDASPHGTEVSVRLVGVTGGEQRGGGADEARSVQVVVLSLGLEPEGDGLLARAVATAALRCPLEAVVPVDVLAYRGQAQRLAGLAVIVLGTEDQGDLPRAEAVAAAARAVLPTPAEVGLPEPDWPASGLQAWLAAASDSMLDDAVTGVLRPGVRLLGAAIVPLPAEQVDVWTTIPATIDRGTAYTFRVETAVSALVELMIIDEFANPYAANPVAATAFRTAYRQAAFGGGAETAPDGDLAEPWNLGAEAGRARRKVYRRAYGRGVDDGFLGQPDAVGPPAEPADWVTAWQEGHEDGLRTAAEVITAIQSKALSSAGFDAPSASVHHRRVRGDTWLYWQEYDQDSRGIFLQVPGEAHAVDAPSFAAYLRLGGAAQHSALGLPLGDTGPAPQDPRGTVTPFERGEIYATPQHGAYEVHGPIRDRWLQLGGPLGLGFPTSDQVLEIVAGGQVSTFERGDIFQWGETITETRGVRIVFTGLNCFGDTSEAMEDEAYALFSVARPNDVPLPGAPPVNTKSYTTTSRIFDALGGGSYPTSQPIYEGPISDVGAVVVTVMEFDSGGPDTYRAAVESGVRTALGAAAGAIALTGVGLPVSALAAWLLQAGAPALTDAINGLLGTADDTVGTAIMPLAPKTLVDLGRGPMQRERDVGYRLATPLLSGDGGSYKAYFDVQLL